MVDVVCVEQPQASWEERSMKHYAGLDVSVKETSICIVDEAGRICREMKVVSHPEDLLAVLCDPAWRLERVGLEDACKPETKGAPRRSKDTPGKGSCDRERYPWFVAQFWTESRNRWRCRFRAADPRPRRGSAGVSRVSGLCGLKFVWSLRPA